ncbi:MAG: hypothetical protein J1F25_07620, partial [Prevotellaceae bacterium]|nr:hypothetical protein [Prevotellaceae bacterium]
MKRRLLAFALCIGCTAAAMADDWVYPYLLLQATDGSITALPADMIEEITIDNGKLVVTMLPATVDHSQRFELSSLQSMQFSTDATEADAIHDVDNDADDRTIQMYDLQGRPLQHRPQRGIYIKKQHGKTTKEWVK